MKTIVATTDFSDASLNAVHYAADLAKHIDAHLVLLNVTHTPPVSVELPVVFPTQDELEREGLGHLEKIKNKIKRYGAKDLVISCVCLGGFAVDQIIDFVHRHQPTLVVMGMQGAGFLTETFVGSITTSLIWQADFPILAINETAKFQIPRRIVFASDRKPVEITGLNFLKELVELFKAHVYILHVSPPAEVAGKRNDQSHGYVAPEELKDMPHSLHFVNGDTAADGISTFIAETDMQLLVMGSGKHSFPRSIFTGSETKKMAFRSTIPLLALPLQS